MGIFAFVLLSSSLLPFFFVLSYAADSIKKSESLSESITLVSKHESYALGFFRPGNSSNRYLGIWYNNIPVRTVVWVANRLNPINDSSGMLMVNSSGSLVLLSQNRTVAWSANSTKQALNPIVQLLDSGNLVLREENEEDPENYLWQSFDYPSDTWLPGMKLGWDLRTGLERRLTAWKSPDDPSPGELSVGIELHNYPEIVMNKGTEKFFRIGPWNGLSLSGLPDLLKENPVYTYDFVINSDEVYFIYNLIKNSVISRALLNETSSLYERYIWVSEDKKWSLYFSMPKDKCEGYNLCGPYGNCIIGDSPICQCVEGFKHKSPDTWNPDEWSKGCVRITQLSCKDKDKIGFAKFVGLKMPDTTYSWVNGSMNLNECRVKCLNNCSCTAYANSNITDGGSGCAMWFGDLIDIRQVTANGRDAYMQNVYIRMPASEEVNHKEEKDKQKMKVIVIVVVAIAVVFGVLLIPYCISKRANFREKMENNVMIDQNIEGQSEDMEVPFFTLATIVIATNNFSSYNKLGEGGFGLVYKGTLIDGKEIAVKRLSRKSGQGLSEFKNEVILIAKLQHRNLVRLLGYCIEGDEKMLIYEYMPNGSLDSFIFDETKAKVLGWSMRFNIICGIARGLLYLHEDSRLRIIHRDLKASNILLDSKMNPKISDFGMARIFGGDQIEGNTNRVVGTYGYMAPEYAIDGLFSVKSDVFSFGILLLEIISGKKNRGSFHLDNTQNLVGHAWKLWQEDRPLELIDTCLKGSVIQSEILRCLHISFLCLQQHHNDRPNMSCVVMMLHGESSLPKPKELGFFVGKKSTSSSENQSSSTNEITITMLEAR
ncbi:G-type lectin S-receptor-like serine/threonine-protein kinase At4g27290 isoform X2 [Quercus suber]|uniref:G-type lectin S-receptor-like serine/threonine-protein kinase At4g27290 isoform X2 n=1 Tax=Quercus suber TaxID=58331 RepID=UPI000CE182F1|nr:G-type lectin S-receptor-like serine/threonine-protein kinase At4g27290 [Quercus suber]